MAAEAQLADALVDGKEAVAIQPGEQAHESHPYLTGNFAPIQRTLPLTPCSYTGTIPKELAGGQYVRNGGNPLSNDDLGRDAHWFDGDGMLSGVLFRRIIHPETKHTIAIRPEFVNQFILTDVYMASKSSKHLVRPILPSIATLVSPLASLWTVICTILRTLVLVLLSWLPGSQWAIKKISVANTAIVWHDGRALATCESGPPIRVMLPGLETVGWFDGKRVEGEKDNGKGPGYGGGGMTGWMKEWTTGHPRVDPMTGELISYHNTFLAPYVHYSIVPPTHNRHGKMPLLAPSRLLNTPVPGVSGAKMMHDFGVSLNHTVIMDLPLTLNPFNLARNLPVVAYDPTAKSRFGVFPRYRPDLIKWFETRACCIFHTANTWDTYDTDPDTDEAELCVNMLACRLTSASLVYSAGNLAAPQPAKQIPEGQYEEEQCRLYYYQFPFAELSPPTSPNEGMTEDEAGSGNEDDGNDDEILLSPPTAENREKQKTKSSASKTTPTKPIRHEFALSAIPFEFPTMKAGATMSATRYVYGCSTTGKTGFGASLGKGVKISHIAKIDALELIERGKMNPPEPVSGCVDPRSVEQVCASTDPHDPIRIFELPEGWYAQEASFVARRPADAAAARRQREDDGFLMCYVFDESQLDAGTGMARDGAASELWIIDALGMKEVLARVRLPQRVPYGLHGAWFDENQIRGQRDVLPGGLRCLPEELANDATRATDVPAVEEMDDEQKIQSPSVEKENPFDAPPPAAATPAVPAVVPATKRDGGEKVRLAVPGAATAAAAAIGGQQLQRSRSRKSTGKRKWSPAWNAWMATRGAVERALA